MEVVVGNTADEVAVVTVVVVAVALASMDVDGDIGLSIGSFSIIFSGIISDCVVVSASSSSS